jgi:hypothetical protein
MNAAQLRPNPVLWRASAVLALALVGGLFVGSIVWVIKQVFDLLFILPLGIA